MQKFRQLAQSNVAKGLTTAAALAATGAANAADFTVPTEVTSAATSVGLVGAAVFAIAVGIKLYKWIKAAL